MPLRPPLRRRVRVELVGDDVVHRQQELHAAALAFARIILAA
jgi:hypothetical protein